MKKLQLCRFIIIIAVFEGGLFSQDVVLQPQKALQIDKLPAKLQPFWRDKLLTQISFVREQEGTVRTWIEYLATSHHLPLAVGTFDRMTAERMIKVPAGMHSVHSLLLRIAQEAPVEVGFSADAKQILISRPKNEGK